MTDKRKIEIFKKAIKKLQEPENIGDGICFLIFSNLTEGEKNRLKVTYFSCTKLLKFFGILKFKPKNTYNQDYWFGLGEKQKRIEILNKAINELKK